MNKWILIVIVAAILGGLYSTNPGVDEHLSVLSASQTTMADPAQLEYRNFLVASAMRDRQRGSMASWGYLKRVHVVKSYYEASPAPAEVSSE